MSESFKFWLMVVLFGLFLLMLIPGVRDLIIKNFIGGALGGGAVAALQTFATWLFWILKTVVISHLVLLRNLFSPRSSIYPTLEKPKNEPKS